MLTNFLWKMLMYVFLQKDKKIVKFFNFLYEKLLKKILKIEDNVCFSSKHKIVRF